MSSQTGKVDIPISVSTVSVRVISPNRVLGVPPGLFLSPDIKGTAYSDTPCLCFLIEHNTSDGLVQRLLFDLGIRKDWHNSVPNVVRAIEDMGITIDTPADVTDQLQEHGIALSSIEGIVISHWHFDHTGDPTLFPKSTDLLVGPGFKSNFIPGYPVNEAAPIADVAFQDRAVHEVDFSNSELRIAGLEAIDHFGDGSLYLLSTPGHAIGHISALARVNVDSAGVSSFVLLAGDTCHHPGELRPSKAVPLPRTTKELAPGICHSLARSVHPRKEGDEPFYMPAEGPFNADAAMMQDTIRSVTRFDADPNIMVLIAHDNSLLDTLPLFPHKIDEWRTKGWKDSSRWKFLLDFEYPKTFIKS